MDACIWHAPALGGVIVKTLEKRVTDLEAVSNRALCNGFCGLVIPPPMTPEAWAAAAAKQQAELIRRIENDHA